MMNERNNYSKRKKNVAILGSTGSIGTQALEIIENHTDKFNVTLLCANNNAELLIEQAIKFIPNHVLIANESKFEEVKKALNAYPVEVHTSVNNIAELVKIPEIDSVLTAMVGFSGLLPTINAIKSGKDIALANKETLVVGGEIIMRLAREYKVNIYPVDSEHSAIFQCLQGEENDTIEKIILTASGGPFRGKSMAYLQNVTRDEALKHPNWFMGNKVTIDSASLMNKGLEAIEAKWLFGVEPEKIEVVIHPQSIIHSMVQFKDASIKAQMGLPDMKLPIQYALSYPERLESDFTRYDFLEFSDLTFEKPDKQKFKNLNLAFFTMNKGGNAPCILNAANEIVVEAFLKEKIGFLKMSDLIEKSLEKLEFIENPSLNDLIETDKETRLYTNSLVV